MYKTLIFTLLCSSIPLGAVPSPTNRRTVVPGCNYLGKFYPVGEISRGSDGRGRCYGTVCKPDGQVMHWDNWNCGTTPATTTSPPAKTPSPPTSTPPPNKTPDRHIMKTDSTPTNPLSHTTLPPTTTQSPVTTTPSTTNSPPTTTQVTTILLTFPFDDPSLCYYEGKYYRDGDKVTEDFDGTNWCSGLYCNQGDLVPWDDFNCKGADSSSPTITNPTLKTLNPTTTQPPVITPPSVANPPSTTPRVTTDPPTFPPADSSACYHEGKYYNDGEIVSRKFDGMNRCFGLYCNEGDLVPWDDFNCRTTTTSVPLMTDSTTTANTPPKTTPSPTTAQRPATSRPPRTKPPHTTSSSCYYEGKYYNDGETVSRKFDGMNWCYGLYCNQGDLVPWDDFNCKITTGVPSTTDSITTTDSSLRTKPPHSTSEAITNTPTFSPGGLPLCYHEGKYYRHGDLISRNFNGMNKCSGLYCKQGDVVHWDDFNCRSTGSMPAIITEAVEGTSSDADTSYTIPSKTASPSTSDTIQLPDISSPDTITGPDIASSDTTLSETMSPMTIKSDDTTSLSGTTLRPDITSARNKENLSPEKQGCYYQGSFYPPGEIIRRSDGFGRCYGVICDSSGTTESWKKSDCTTTTSPTPAMKATLPGCFYNDEYYPPGKIRRVYGGGNWCVEVICKEDGTIKSSNNWNCGLPITEPTTRTTITTPERKRCNFNGIYYSPGIITQGSNGKDWCYKVVCQDNGQLYLWGSSSCLTKRPTTTSPPTTTTTPPAKSCFYDGRYYPVGEISRGADGTGWCYGVVCRKDGQVVLWGNLNCVKK